MKLRILALISLLMVSSVCLYSQDKGYKTGIYGPYNQHPIIQADKQLESGAKWVRSSYFTPTVKNSSLKEKDKVVSHIGLSVEQFKDSEPKYYLELCAKTTDFGHMIIYKDSPLLMKLANGEVIQLKCREDAIDKVGEIISLRYGVTLYKAFAQYEVNSDDLDRMKDGVQKIRFEGNAERWDTSFNRYKKDELGEFLYNAKQVVTEALNNQTDFSEGF